MRKYNIPKKSSKSTHTNPRFKLHLIIEILMLIAVCFSAISIMLFEYAKRPKIVEELIYFGKYTIDYVPIELSYNHLVIIRLKNIGQSTAEEIGYELKLKNKITRIVMKSSENSSNYRIRDSSGVGYDYIFIEIDELGKGGYFLAIIFTERLEISEPVVRKFIKSGYFLK